MRIVSPADEATGVLTTLIDPSQLERRFGGGLSTFEFEPDVYLADYNPMDTTPILTTNYLYLTGNSRKPQDEKNLSTLPQPISNEISADGCGAVERSTVAELLSGKDKSRPVSYFGIKI